MERLSEFIKILRPLRRADRQHTRGALLIPKSVNPLGVPADLKSAVKKRFDLLKLEDLQSPNNNKRKSILFCCGAKYKLYLPSLVLCILRVEVGPTAHPVVAAIEGSDVAYGVETCPAGETCGAEQWASSDRSIAICTNQ